VRGPLGRSCVAMACVILASTAVATEREDRPSLAVSTGIFGLIDDYRPRTVSGLLRTAPRTAWALAPGIGVVLGADSLAYIYAEVSRDIAYGRSWRLTPCVGAGWLRNGEAIGIDYPLEFQTGIELAYALRSGGRAGLGFYHLSNAGLSDDNPGTESLRFFVAFPAGRAD